MIVSEARREANPHNATSSAGPRSIGAKARIRASAIQHGTTTDDAAAFRARAAEWHATLSPADATERWFADEVARISLKLDALTEVERTLRDQAAVRAEVSWDADRRLDAEVTARKLADRPGEVVARLKRTVQGCELMIERWLMLAHVGDRSGTWDEGQVRMAFDLLGTPTDLRGADPCVRLDDDGRPLAFEGGPAGFARLEVRSLRAIRDGLEPLDAFDRQATAAGLLDASTPEYRRFRRYEASLRSRLKWCLKQIQSPKPATATPPKPAPISRPSRIEEPVEEFDEFDTSDEAMMAWMRREMDKAGFADIPIVPPSRADFELQPLRS